MWLNLLERLSLIDDLKIICTRKSVKIQVITLALAQFRTKKIEGLQETFRIRWYNENIHISEFDDIFIIDLPINQLKIDWHVVVDFYSSQIRKKSNLLTTQRKFKTFCK